MLLNSTDRQTHTLLTTVPFQIENKSRFPNRFVRFAQSSKHSSLQSSRGSARRLRDCLQRCGILRRQRTSEFKKKTPALFRNDRTAPFNSDSISDVSKKNAALYTDQTIVGKHQSIDIVSATADPRVC
jgi:hypothetical protein